MINTDNILGQDNNRIRRFKNKHANNIQNDNYRQNTRTKTILLDKIFRENNINADLPTIYKTTNIQTKQQIETK